MARSTILVTLFSGDDETNGTLSKLVTSIQDGMNAYRGEMPDIHCLYRLHCREGQGGAFQYQLQRSGVPVPLCTAQPNLPPNTFKQQLQTFFSSQVVRDSLRNGGPFYLIIGAHGAVINATPTLYEPLLRLVDTIFGADSGIAEWINGLLRKRRALPMGAAFEAITITELKVALQSLPRPPQTLILHCCLLSNLETIYELNSIPHHIACESDLGEILDARRWFAELAQNTEARAFTVIDNLSLPVEGIFSSHATHSPGGPQQDYIVALNRVGAVLLTLIQGRNPTTIDQIETARKGSIVSPPYPLIDVWQFCQNLLPVLTDPEALLNLQARVTELQYRRTLVGNPRTDLRMKYFRGINTFLNKPRTHVDLSRYPTDFKEAAGDWFDFLTEWNALT